LGKTLAEVFGFSFGGGLNTMTEPDFFVPVFVPLCFYPVEKQERSRVIGQKNKGVLDGQGCKKDQPKTGLDVLSGKKVVRYPRLGV
jgi:hypothetical protein